MGVMVAEFESLAKAKNWYNSPEYQAVVAGRLESSVGGLIFVDAGSWLFSLENCTQTVYCGV